ncbi:helix-turn-helix DNA-binding protein [Mycobacterium phage Donny]|uniref:Helix-turn-helix DNA binding domain protein n=3 Tax=Acadianvirus acadian TaxID=1982901 RepID=A0A7M1CMT8_9CAUD|nr:HTH DNA binding protein [Mycobacterium phage Acadian]AER48959.1 hypothetical protein ACADIAN_45 [Mycobacterium phage Acadian]QBI96500.1 helix-turn-helix DNA-binding protein [Mycobacterium phage Donny]QOP65587.1 helix-turn-helix DNA binding domain protein [Mycobacterium phage Suigeneris]WUT94815.1 helix-turn-helix DNA binding domain [Mycobacterium phage PRodriguez]
MNPETRTMGLGETITAHRAYMGLSQRGMASRLAFDRRDYQRIEKGDNMCPAGFLDKVTELVDQFDAAVDSVLEYAATHGGEVNVEVQRDPRWEWERNVAYRAHVIGAASTPATRVVLTLVGEVSEEAS